MPRFQAVRFQTSFERVLPFFQLFRYTAQNQRAAMPYESHGESRIVLLDFTQIGRRNCRVFRGKNHENTRDRDRDSPDFVLSITPGVPKAEKKSEFVGVKSYG